MRRACVLVLLLSVGCRHEVGPGEREETFRPFLNERVGQVELSEHLVRATALLLAGSHPRKVQGRPGSWDLDLSPGEDGSVRIGLGSAIALTDDGYFLTAAHNLTNPPFTIAIVMGDRINFAEAKPVWVGTASIPEEDIAVVKANVRPEAVLEWGDPATAAAGTDLASMSAPHGRCGGKVLEASLSRSDRFPCTVCVLRHDLPLLQGDSGGPVVGRNGRLLGMNVLQKGNWAGAKEGVSILPDRIWVQSTIAASR